MATELSRLDSVQPRDSASGTLTDLGVLSSEEQAFKF